MAFFAPTFSEHIPGTENCVESGAEQHNMPCERTVFSFAAARWHEPDGGIFPLHRFDARRSFTEISMHQLSKPGTKQLSDFANPCRQLDRRIRQRIKHSSAEQYTDFADKEAPRVYHERLCRRLSAD